MPKLPKAPSPGEEGLARDCQCYHVKVEREFQFAPPRRWRADFCVLDRKLLIEVEGGTWTNGRHNRGSGMEADCVKYATAVLLGYKLLRFTTSQVVSGYAIDTILQVLAQ